MYQHTQVFIMPGFRTSLHATATHNGIEPTTGMWRFPGYERDVAVRESLFTSLQRKRANGVQFAMMENIRYLPDTALTRVRFDVDLHLAVGGADVLVPYIDRFLTCLYKILCDTTLMTPEDESRIIVQRKPEPTKVNDTNYKHGFKATCVDLIATHTYMLQVRALLYERFDEWGDRSWLKDGQTAADTEIIDSRVYHGHGWFMYGSQKEEQISGGYVATDIWEKIDVKGDLSDLSYYELVRMLSIFADEFDDPVVLTWAAGVELPCVTRKRTNDDEGGVPTKRRRSPTTAALDSDVSDVITHILKSTVKDTTSTVNPNSREERIAGTYTYRLTRVVTEVCPYGQKHITNGFYIHLDTSKPSVYYQCLSTSCKGKARVLLQADPDLVQRWVKLETSGDTTSTSDDTTSTLPIDTTSTLPIDITSTTSGDTASTSVPDYGYDSWDFDDDIYTDMMDNGDDVAFEAPGDVDLPEVTDDDLKHMLNILSLAPADAIDNSKELSSIGWLLKQGVQQLVNEQDVIVGADDMNVVSDDDDQEPVVEQTESTKPRSKKAKAGSKRGRATKKAKQDTEEDFNTAKARSSASDTWNADLLAIWRYICQRSSTQNTDRYILQQWDGFKVLGDKHKHEDYIARVVSKVCAWRATSDLDFDLEFVIAVDSNIIKPSVGVLKAAVEHARCTRKAKADAECDMSEENNADNQMKLEEATDKWREAVDAYVLLEAGSNLLVKPAVYDYISTFFTLVVSSAKTEVVQQIFQVQTIDGEQKHVMSGYHRRVKGQFIDAHGQIIGLVLSWLQEVPAASGFTMDPVYVHQKHDKCFTSSKKLPQFNTFCGYAIDAILSIEEARNFKYDQVIVDRVVAHFKMLVNGDEYILEYLLRWIAAPLQRRGYRTGVMVINRSTDKGVGKGLIWNEFIGNLIYGGLNKERPHYYSAYNQIKDIDYLVGTHNEGLIGKTFLNMDECGIFDGAIKQNEKMKGLITERTLQVNQKFMTLVTYENCLNFLLSTNKSDSMKVDPGDRRYLVIDSKTKKPKSYFVGEHGFAAFLLKNPEVRKHFYAYLMQLYMGNFYEIDPPSTDAKKSSMAKAMPIEAKFVQALSIRLQQLTIDEKSIYDKVAQSYKSVICADEEILTEEFLIHKGALSYAFDAYCKKYKQFNKSSDGLINFIKENLNSTTKSKNTHFKDYGQCRPVVMPPVEQIEQQLRTKGMWDDEFEMDMIETEEEKKNNNGLYWGSGIKRL
jgi:Family of unknown function (DUF5906)